MRSCRKKAQKTQEAELEGGRDASKGIAGVFGAFLRPSDAWYGGMWADA